MNRSRATLSCMFALAVVVAFAEERQDAPVLKITRSADSLLAEMMEPLFKLHLVTKAPHKMEDWTARGCGIINPQPPHQLHWDSPEPAYCNVYVNDLAKTPMLSGRGKYPVGSLIVKSKLRTKDAKDIELFTVMRKQGAGYDPKNGNWEYSVLEGKRFLVLSRGRIDSCAACHAAYEKTDFVTREYLSDVGEKADK